MGMWACKEAAIFKLIGPISANQWLIWSLLQGAFHRSSRSKMTDVVLRRIRRRCTAIERAYHQGSAGPREAHAIDISIANLRRVEESVSAEAIRDSVQSLTDL
ncbi:hypothetical protein PAMA_006550 [Pampus argenteus]